MEMTRIMLGVSAIIKRVTFFTLLASLSGCALHYTDKEGNDRHIGFVSITTEKNNCVVISTIRSAGLSLDVTSDSGGLNLGARSISKSYIKNGDYVELEEDEYGSLEAKKYNKSLQRTHKNCAAE